MTIAQWRKTRATGAKARHAPRALGAVLRLVPRREAPGQERGAWTARRVAAATAPPM